MNELTHLSLFSGIGGLDLAAECYEKLTLEAATGSRRSAGGFR